MPINDAPQAPFTYPVCYAAADPVGPGSTVHVGEDVCVDDASMNGDGTSDLDW